MPLWYSSFQWRHLQRTLTSQPRMRHSMSLFHWMNKYIQIYIISFISNIVIINVLRRNVVLLDCFLLWRFLEDKWADFSERMTSKTRHDVKKLVMTSKTRHVVKQCVMTWKTRHDVKNTMQSKSASRSQKDAMTWKSLLWRQNHVMK